MGILAVVTDRRRNNKGIAVLLGGKGAASATAAVADARTRCTVCGHYAAVDDSAARTTVPAANACAAATTPGSDCAAVDGDGAARTTVTTADARLSVASRGGQFTHIAAIGLVVDGQAAAILHSNALFRVQFAL